MSNAKRYSVAVEFSSRYEYARSGPSDELVTLAFLDEDSNLKKEYGGNVLRAMYERGLRPSETAFDLLLLATAVYIADTRISRQKHSQDGWTREIDILLPVRTPDIWQEAANLLEDTLRFLTGDIWRLQFFERQIELNAMLTAQQMVFGSTRTSDSVCLFSGGLDSFAGAVDLFEKGKKPILVGHYFAGGDRSHQNKVFNGLGREYQLDSERLFSVQIGPERGVDVIPGGSNEDSTRSRSFMFLALGSIVADSLGGRTPLHVPENGLISLGIPLDSRRIGAHSTRTTHPYFMHQFQSLLNLLGLGVVIEAPFRFKTKGELLKCANPELVEKLCTLTMSCSSPGKYRFLGIPRQHCGHCVPCVIRRAALNMAFGHDPTIYTYSDKKIKGRQLDSNAAEGRDIRSLQFMAKRLEKHPDHAKLLIFKPGPLPDSEKHMNDYVGVLTRGMAEVYSFLTGVETTPAR